MQKIALANKLRADQVRGMLAAIQFRIFCLPFSSKNVMIKSKKL